MKKIPLSKGKYVLVDNADFHYLNKWKWLLQRGRKTYYASGYLKEDSKSKRVLMHRLLLNAERGMTVDHEDGNGLNNRRGNLRLCTNAKNLQNRTTLFKNNKSGTTGVYFSKIEKKWKVQVYRNNSTICLGTFNNKKKAILSRNKFLLLENSWSKI